MVKKIRYEKVVEWNNPFNEKIQEAATFWDYPLWAILTMIPCLNIILGIIMFIFCLKRRKVYWRELT